MLNKSTTTIVGAVALAVTLAAGIVYLGYGVRPASAKDSFPVLYVSNFNSDEVTAYDSRSGAFLGVIVKSHGELRGANGIAVGPDGDIYLAGQFSNNIVRYDGASGKFKAVVDPDNKAGVSAPQGLNFGPDGLLYAASYNNDKVVTYNTSTNSFAAHFADVKLASVRHMGPQDPFFGPDGNMYLGNFDGNFTLKYQGPKVGNQRDAAGARSPGTLLATFDRPAAPAGAAALSGGAFASGVSAFAHRSNPAPSVAAPAAAAKPESFIYIDHIDPKSFTGEVLQYTTDGKFVKSFVPFNTAGLVLTGGIDVGPDKNLYVANVKVNHQFQDVGSTILRFDVNSGKYLGTFVAQGKHLEVPFAMCFTNRATKLSR